MLRQRGPRLVWHYFWQNHWFDIKHGTNTHARILKEHYPDTPQNFEHGVLYMSSWSHVVVNSTLFALRHNAGPVEDVALVDVGSGKGKVICLWSTHSKFNPQIKKIGIEYSPALSAICADNLNIVSARNTAIYTLDAAKHDYNHGVSTLILYLYNPFDRDLMERFLKALPQDKTIYIIYNNSLHSDLILEEGFKTIKDQPGWHPNVQFQVLLRRR